MKDKKYILQLIRDTVHKTEPGASVILYGSCAHGDEREDSDIDILILVDRDMEKISWDEKMKIIAPISRVEWATGAVINPVVYTRKGWANHRVTPYYENVNREGILL